MQPIEFVVHFSAVKHPQCWNRPVTNALIKSLDLSVPKYADIRDKANSLFSDF